MRRAAEAPLEKPPAPADGVSSSDDSSDSDSDDDAAVKGNKFGLPTSAQGSRSDGIREKKTKLIPNGSAKENTRGVLIRKAEMYQAYMKHIPIPAAPGSQVPFTCWQGLADSLKVLHHQP